MSDTLDNDKLSPTDQSLIEEIIYLHKQNQEWGTSKIATTIRTNHPEWTLSEKRIKKVIQKYELLDGSPTIILLGENDVPIDRDVYTPFFTGEVESPPKPINNTKQPTPLKENVRERLREKIKQFDYRSPPNPSGIQITIEKGGLESIIGNENFEPVAINLGDPEALREYMNERMSDLVKSMGFPIVQMR